METDILSLVPRNNPVVEGFRTTIERFGSVDTLLVVIHLEEERPLETTIDFADRLALSLRNSDDIDWVEYRVGPPCFSNRRNWMSCWQASMTRVSMRLLFGFVRS